MRQAELAPCAPLPGRNLLACLTCVVTLRTFKLAIITVTTQGNTIMYSRYKRAKHLSDHGPQCHLRRAAGGWTRMSPTALWGMGESPANEAEIPPQNACHRMGVEESARG